MRFCESAFTKQATVPHSNGLCSVFLKAFFIKFNSVLCHTSSLLYVIYFPSILKYDPVCFCPLCSVSSLRLAQLSLTPSDSQQIISCFSNSRCTQGPNDVSSNSYDCAFDGVLFSFENKSTNSGFQSIKLGPALCRSGSRHGKSDVGTPKTEFCVDGHGRYCM